jgi:hypothetical protein
MKQTEQQRRFWNTNYCVEDTNRPTDSPTKHGETNYTFGIWKQEIKPDPE